LKDANWKKKYRCAMVNEAKIESGGKQEHNLIRTEELIIRPFCRVDNKLAKVKKATTGDEFIALSTHGRRGLERWKMGSITDQVLHRTKLPLLTVLPGDTETK
jgi:nucleotide-binding universal stress UspA family protein